VLIVSNDEIILLFIRALVFLRELLNCIAGNDILELLAVEVGPAKAIRVDDRLGSRASSVVTLSPDCIGEDGICESDGLEIFVRLILEMI